MDSKYVLIGFIDGQQTTVKSYRDEKEALKDIYFKDPVAFFIADAETKVGMTLNEFIEKYDK